MAIKAIRRSHPHLQPNSELDHRVLSALSSSDQPLGSSFIQERLEDEGLHLSEPTVGRFLRLLDRRKLTVRVSNRGRTLTAAGKRRLQEIEHQAERRFFEDQLLSSIQPSTLDEILQVLVARRAVERETARQAAMNASADGVQELEAFVAQQSPVTVHPGFHETIARIGGNRVLAAILGLIMNDRKLHAGLRAILEQQHVLFDATFNDKIIDAIRRRDADAAETAMVDHLDRLVDAVKRFGVHTPPSSSRTSSDG